MTGQAHEPPDVGLLFRRVHVESGVAEAAQAVGVSRRVLERGFLETVGVSPQRYRDPER
jgi:transcriptional regulator GlxA family with amidase domain